MTVKYIAFDGKEFDNEKECKNYEEENGRGIRIEIGNARFALRRLDEFCEFWSNKKHCGCGNCPLTHLCDGLTKGFEEYFNKENPFGNIDEDGTLIEED